MVGSAINKQYEVLDLGLVIEETFRVGVKMIRIFATILLSANDFYTSSLFDFCDFRLCI